jgi:hypothetical protein
LRQSGITWWRAFLKVKWLIQTTYRCVFL